MLNADSAPYFCTCPRCGMGALEHLKTHSYCVNCNYAAVSASDEMLAIPRWVPEYLKTARPRSAVKPVVVLHEREANDEIAV